MVQNYKYIFMYKFLQTPSQFNERILMYVANNHKHWGKYWEQKKMTKFDLIRWQDEEDKTLSNLTNKIRTLQLDKKWGLSKTDRFQIDICHDK